MNSYVAVTAERYHDFSCGHRVHGHEGACAHLHGHNYRVHFKCRADQLDKVGRVIDFSVMKTLLCEWLEENWDHKFLVWQDDPYRSTLCTLDPAGVVVVPFNPTAENMAGHLLAVVGPRLLRPVGVELVEVVVEETRKCSARAALNVVSADEK
jgi:6-pyruvoyltetrahydropterin/6-carboxytetrahydropterin synthase